ncbi:MAG: GH92 family glycosyl hydrolase [Deltaproteobacteria bacterium]|nr:GH92 family glycosyl hydrolase [Deltaproteobacteria bacterium]
MYRFAGLMIVVCSLQLSCKDNNNNDNDQPFCPAGEDLSAYVDPMIGTLGSGNVVPGALVPHGMVKLSPDTNAESGSVDAYEYANDKIEGFSHTHLQGPGGGFNGYSHVMFLPTTGVFSADVEDYASTFSHDTEVASPGYYKVGLDDYAITAELTATAHAGFHRYTYPQTDQAHILIDLGHSRGDSRGGKVQIVDPNTIKGYGVYNVHPMLDLILSSGDNITGQSTVYFHAVFDKPFESFGTWKKGENGIELSDNSDLENGPWIGAYVNFATQADEAVEVRVGISMVSMSQAKKNLEVEIGELTFEAVHKLARDTWNCYLNRIQLEGGTAQQRTIFYTALFHTLFAPADYTEVGGKFFSGADGQGDVFELEQGRFYTDDWCAWDTFRTSRPLATIVEPETINDVVASYLHLYQQGGWLPKCTWHATGYSRVMIGNHSVAIIADAYTKGFDQYDLDLAWAALEKSATQDDEDKLVDGVCGYVNLGTPPEYIQNGYISHECDTHQSASMTLEYAYNDYCIAQVADGMGKPDEYQTYMARAENYENIWNPETGFMQGRKRDGSWLTSFDPADTQTDNDFCEASSWIYTWFVPHDVPGLIDLIGDKQTFVEKLDEFFAGDYFEPSNEPSFHIPYLYNFAAAAHRTQELVRATLETEFSVEPNGLPGNDDAGATSAWIVFSAIGLYPVAPGDGRYQLASPLFDRTTLQLNPANYPGKQFVIETVNNSRANLYIQSATLNGAPLSRTWITHDEIIAGGTLSFAMGPEPSSWGSAD